jgi:hypothetical protein
MRHPQTLKLSLFAALVALATHAAAQVAPVAGQIGTSEFIERTTPSGDKPAKRVGIVAYCADIAANAGDTGLQAGMSSVADGGAKQRVIDDYVFGGSPPAPPDNRRAWFLDGPRAYVGQVGATNIAHMLMYDDGIDRVRDIQVIDGDLVQPTATQLINSFDVVVAYTDNKCGPTIPTAIANAAASALTTFAQTPGKGLVLTGFAFSNQIGFGNALFGGGLSPIRKSNATLDITCTRDTPCRLGNCPPPNVIVTNHKGFPECQVPQLDEFGNNVVDANGNPTGTGEIATKYQPFTRTNDLACEHMLAGVRGPTTSSWVTAIAPASLAPGATLCFNYDAAATTTTPYLAINAARNIVAINAFPADARDIQKFWFSCILANAIEYLAGVKDRCTVPGAPNC